MSEKLRDAIDARAESLGLTRSQYLAQLARQDIAAGGSMIISSAQSPVAFADAAMSSDISAIVAKPEAGSTSYGSKRKVARHSKAQPAPGSPKKAL